MQTTISAKHITLTPANEAYITQKMAKLPRYFNRVSQIEVIVDKVKDGFEVEIITDVEHHEPFVATSKHEDLYACVDVGIDRAVRQLRDHKSRLRENKHHTPTSGSEP